MKTRTIYLTGLVLMTLACTKENSTQNNNGQNETKLVPMEFTVLTETTKTSLGDGGSVNWNVKDKIAVFDPGISYSSNPKHQIFTTTNGDGTFIGEVSQNPTELYALYPQRNAAVYTNGYITSKLFPDQEANVGSFSTNVGGAPVMAAKIDLESNTAKFKNLCSHICFTLDKEDVISLTLIGNNSEPLCGLYKITFDKDGNPTLEVSSPETYVTIRNRKEQSDTEYSALEKGDYYFTIFPTTFANGFTVILGYKDGTQKAVRTEKSHNELSTRNQILKMSKVPESKYSNHLNYFVQYNDLKDVTIGDSEKGGYTFNATTQPNANLITSYTKDKTITKDGIYFIEPNAGTINMEYNAVNKLIICSTESNLRVNLTTTKNPQPATNEEGVLAFENVALSIGTQDFITQANAKSNPGTKFGDIIFDNCRINIRRNLINITNAAIEINNVVVANTDFTPSESSSFILRLGTIANSEKQSSLKNLYFYNNVCYYTNTTTPMTEFRVCGAEASDVENMYICNNTFDSTTLPNGGAVKPKTLKSCTVENNLFDNSVLTDKNSNLINTVTNMTDGINGNVDKNYYYSNSNYELLIPRTFLDNIKNNGGQGINPSRIDVSPLPEGWNPADGVYGSYAGVPEGIGATR